MTLALGINVLTDKLFEQDCETYLYYECDSSVAVYLYSFRLCTSMYYYFILHLSRHSKKRDLWFSGLWFFKCACTVPFFDYRYEFFAWSFLKVPTGETALIHRLVWAFAGYLCKEPFSHVLYRPYDVLERQSLTKHTLPKVQKMCFLRNFTSGFGITECSVIL